jgi:uncharacterized protein YlxW (UPF0749 family)
MSTDPRRQNWRSRLSAAFATRTHAYGARSLGWRLLAPAVFVIAGALFITSMVASQGTDLRAGRYDDLDGLANAEAQNLEGLRARSADLDAEVNRLTKDLGTGSDAEQKKVDALQGPAGLSPVHGPGLTITLDDAPDDALAAAGDGVSQLLVHQQDIQAVANALWTGGAEAMTLQGQRVVATTGIKCVGNTVVLHGVPYSPPYRVSAIGPVGEMLGAVDQSPYIGFYLDQVPKGLGWDVQVEPRLRMPGYDGSTELEYARPATGASTTAGSRD